jgi:hypothetical protein
LSLDGADGSGNTEVIVKAFRKGADGQNELASITHYRIEVQGSAPRVDKFSFHRVSGADSDSDTLEGRITYRGLPDSVTVTLVWSDGTTSDGMIQSRDGEFWFSAVHQYAGKAPSTMVGLRFINPANSKILGFFEIKPQSSTMLDPAAPPSQAPASNPRHGDATPAHRSNRAFALHTPGGSAMTKSDLALMFGAGALAIAGGLQKRNAQPQAGRTSELEVDDASPIAELPVLWLDRSLASAIRRQQGASAAGLAPTAKPKLAAVKPDWLATPYRVPAATSTGGIDDLDAWHEVDGWLVASDRAAAHAADAADWLVVRE